MPDFFTRLAERALGTQPTVRAVVPSIFAPEPRLAIPRAVPAEPLAEESWEENGGAASPPSPPLPRRQEPTVRHALDMREEPAEGETRTAGGEALESAADAEGSSRRGHEISEMRGFHRQPVNWASRAPTSAETHPRPGYEPGSTLPVERLPGKAQPIQVSAAVEPTQQTTVAGTTPERGPAPAPPARTASAAIRRMEAEASGVASREEPRSPRRTESAFTDDAMAAPRRPGIPRRAPETPAAPRHAWAAPAAPPEAPTVRVTIGRVEVKAVLPAQAPRSAPPSRPELSLDDYLKQRKAGQR